MASRRSTRLSVASYSGGQSKTTNEDSYGSSAPKKSVKRKGVPDEKTNDGSEQSVAVPSTPKRKKTVKYVPPYTPTPAAASIMAAPHDHATLLQVDRLADPHKTNAPLVSPMTSKVVASTSVAAASPLKAVSSHARTTTRDILEKAVAHLITIDPRLKPIIEKHHCRVFSPEGLADEIDPFEALSSGIISQQVSGAAAKSIKAKFVSLFNTEPTESPISKVFPSPSQVAALDIATLRTAGLSERKAEYIKGLAEKFASGELSTEMLFRAEYEEVLEKLIAVRGLGKWSVEMFACFSLKRMDVFSTGDLGVQRGMAALEGKDVSKLKAKGGGKWKYMSEKDMLEISEKFAPYRSVFMWYMWRVEETDISTLES